MPVVDSDRPVPYEIEKRIPTEYASHARAAFLGDCAPSEFACALDMTLDDMTLLACIAGAKSEAEHEREVKRKKAKRR